MRAQARPANAPGERRRPTDQTSQPPPKTKSACLPTDFAESSTGLALFAFCGPRSQMIILSVGGNRMNPSRFITSKGASNGPERRPPDLYATSSLSSRTHGSTLGPVRSSFCASPSDRIHRAVPSKKMILARNESPGSCLYRASNGNNGERSQTPKTHLVASSSQMQTHGPAS